MRAMLKYFPNNIIAIAAILAIALSPVHAAEKSKPCEYRTFNIKTNNKATSAELLAELGEVCDFSIVVKDTEAEKALAKNLNGVNIKNLSLDEVFQLIIQDNDLFYTYDKNYLKVSALSTKSFKVDYISSIREGKAVINASVDATPVEATGTGTKNTTTQSQNSISSNESFDFWKTISAELTSVLNTGGENYIASSPIINANAGMITVTATKKQLDRVSDYIDLLKDRLHRQVLIDVSIISVALSSSNKTGVDWSQFSLSFGSNSIFNNSNQGALSTSNPNTLYNSSSTGTANASSNLNSLTVVNDALFSVSGVIDFLGSSGDTKVISSPKVLTMNNQQALITVGDNINYRIPEETSSTETSSSIATTYTNYSIFIGVLLNITPEISEDNEIILRINPSVSNFKYSDDDSQQTNPREIAPDTQEKKLSTVVKVKDGSTIILGGLIASTKGKEESSVPLLSSIPLLGEAFKHSADTIATNELVFVITPRIIGVKGSDKATLKDLGYSQRIYE
ncbi:type II secretion system protein D [Sulfurospirillum multivorans DSM 12446]|uniref:Type II secretion system protein D n=3 Tax=Sulfurospirillum multivorans TaxID=66821 RepID=A0AA86AN03_SULMK|nr:pilus (MSHA type) biogenesis protein MshL [Sulfurospirillum multivorans]AHJ12752.1 type II secretion system protein D [Sulfurospirillum multivorans DSM 12446]QEH06247.1 type II secretion system protein D [Sulfurospirillum multivorans]